MIDDIIFEKLAHYGKDKVLAFIKDELNYKFSRDDIGMIFEEAVYGDSVSVLKWMKETGFDLAKVIEKTDCSFENMRECQFRAMESLKLEVFVWLVNNYGNLVANKTETKYDDSYYYEYNLSDLYIE